MTVTRQEREDFVAGLMRTFGTSRANAERRWAAMHPEPAIVELEPEDVRALEKATQAEIVKLFRAFGCVVRSTSQARASKVAPGIPDLLVHHRATRQFWYWESKRPQGGALSPDQVVFAEDCAACDVLWGTGSRVDAEAWLVERGIAVRVPGGLEPARRQG